MSRDRIWASKTHEGARVPLAWPRLLAMHARLTRRMDANLRTAHGLTLRDYEVLLWLSWAPDAQLRRSDLAQSVHLTEGGVTRLVRGLEEAGLVASARGASDRRVVYAQLTESGRDLLSQAARTHVADIQELFTDRLSTRELGMLSDLLSRLDHDNSGP